MDAYIYFILDAVKTALYSLSLFLALLYLCLILFIPRFHTQNNMFILNILVNGILSTIYFALYFYAVEFRMSPSICTLFHYAFNTASLQVAFAFIAITIHRFCVIVYHTKAFFKTKKWTILCISIQWITQSIASVPFIFARRRVVILF